MTSDIYSGPVSSEGRKVSEDGKWPCLIYCVLESYDRII